MCQAIAAGWPTILHGKTFIALSGSGFFCQTTLYWWITGRLKKSENSRFFLNLLSIEIIFVPTLVATDGCVLESNNRVYYGIVKINLCKRWSNDQYLFNYYFDHRAAERHTMKNTYKWKKICRAIGVCTVIA